MLTRLLFFFLGPAGFRTAGVLLIAVLTWLGLRHCRGLIRFFLRLGLSDRSRAPYLEGIALSVSRWLIWLAAVLGVLSLFGANVWQILTGAGIVGVALGLGAQNVVRDMIAGLCLIAEDQFSPGDWVEINGQFEGMIESLDLRATRLRGWDGAVVYLGNSSITRVKNFNRDGLRVIVEATVPYESNHERVREIIEGVCREMAHTHRQHLLQHGGALVEPLFLYGITDISSAKGLGVTYCVMGLTRVESYWHMLRETRRLLVERLGQNGVLLAYPQRIYRQP